MAVAKERERGIERDDCCGGSIKCKFVLKRPIFPENIVGPSLVARLSLSLQGYSAMPSPISTARDRGNLS